MSRVDKQIFQAATFTPLLLLSLNLNKTQTIFFLNFCIFFFILVLNLLLFIMIEYLINLPRLICLQIYKNLSLLHLSALYFLFPDHREWIRLTLANRLTFYLTISDPVSRENQNNEALPQNVALHQQLNRWRMAVDQVIRQQEVFLLQPRPPTEPSVQAEVLSDLSLMERNYDTETGFSHQLAAFLDERLLLPLPLNTLTRVEVHSTVFEMDSPIDQSREDRSIQITASALGALLHRQGDAEQAEEQPQEQPVRLNNFSFYGLTLESSDLLHLLARFYTVLFTTPAAADLPPPLESLTSLVIFSRGIDDHFNRYYDEVAILFIGETRERRPSTSATVSSCQFFLPSKASF